MAEEKEFSFGCANLREQPSLKNSCLQIGGIPCSQSLTSGENYTGVNFFGERIVRVLCKEIGFRELTEQPRAVVDSMPVREVAGLGKRKLNNLFLFGRPGIKKAP